jgi:hypothetical protein
MPWPLGSYCDAAVTGNIPDEVPARVGAVPVRCSSVPARISSPGRKTEPRHSLGADCHPRTGGGPYQRPRHRIVKLRPPGDHDCHLSKDSVADLKSAQLSISVPLRRQAASPRGNHPQAASSGSTVRRGGPRLLFSPVCGLTATDAGLRPSHCNNR